MQCMSNPYKFNFQNLRFFSTLTPEFHFYAYLIYLKIDPQRLLTRRRVNDRNFFDDPLNLM